MSSKISGSDVGGCLYGIGSFLILILYVVGLFHTYRHHTAKEFDLAFIPPIGVYRGAESFWHKPSDEYINESDQPETINWDERTIDDISTASTLILISDDSKDMDEEKMQIESLSQKISKYPDEQKKKIAIGVRCFLEYNLNAGADVNSFVKDLITDSAASLRLKPITTMEYDSLANFYKMPEAIQIKIAMDSVMQKSPFKGLTKEQLNDIYNKTESGLSSHREIYKIYFKKIFNEDYN